MLAHPRIHVMLGTDYRDIVHLVPWKHLAYTGPVDAFFDHRFGRLPYRSLEFEHMTRQLPPGQSHLLPVGTINHANDSDYTRVTEFKHLTGQQHAATSLAYERKDSRSWHQAAAMSDRRGTSGAGAGWGAWLNEPCRLA